jgi:hypothetical protein
MLIGIFRSGRVETAVWREWTWVIHKWILLFVLIEGASWGWGCHPGRSSVMASTMGIRMGGSSECGCYHAVGG